MVVSPGSEPGGRWFDSNPRSFFVMRPWCNGSTAGSNPARSGFKSLGACFQKNNSPVAQRQRQLSYKESIGGSSPSRTTSLGRRGCVSSWSPFHFASHRAAKVLVEQRSARLPVTQEIAGSNPVGNAFSNWHGTQTGKAAKLKPS